MSTQSQTLLIAFRARDVAEPSVAALALTDDIRVGRTYDFRDYARATANGRKP